MTSYEDGKIRRLAVSLAEHGVPITLADAVLEGGAAITGKTSPEAKAAWWRDAMARMDALLDESTRRAVREQCACCLGGRRIKVSRGIGREHGNLDARIAAANDAKLVFGHSVTRTSDGQVLVSFFPEGLERYECVCLRRAGAPISETYCYCCAGHVKHHLQHALGCRVEMTVRSSALASGGRQPCTFLCRLLDESLESPRSARRPGARRGRRHTL